MALDDASSGRRNHRLEFVDNTVTSLDFFRRRHLFNPLDEDVLVARSVEDADHVRAGSFGSMRHRKSRARSSGVGTLNDAMCMS